MNGKIKETFEYLFYSNKNTSDLLYKCSVFNERKRI